MITCEEQLITMTDTLGCKVVSTKYSLILICRRMLCRGRNRRHGIPTIPHLDYSTLDRFLIITRLHDKNSSLDKSPPHVEAASLDKVASWGPTLKDIYCTLASFKLPFLLIEMPTFCQGHTLSTRSSLVSEPVE